MKKKIFLSVFFLLFAMILLSAMTIVAVLYGNVIGQNQDSLRSFADVISGPCELHGADFLKELVTDVYLSELHGFRRTEASSMTIVPMSLAWKIMPIGKKWKKQ